MIINSGYIDSQVEILLRDYENRDHRLKVFTSNERWRVGKNRNFLIERAKGDYVALMDSDDISHPQRFEIQLNYLLNHKNIHMVSTFIR